MVIRGIVSGLLGIVTLFSGLSHAGAQPNNSTGYLPLRSSAAAGISDLVLIYQGGTHRPAWTPEQLAPYVSHRDATTGKESWLFDGFLFIEFMDGRGHEFTHGYGKQSARKEDWLWLLDRNFEKGLALDALEQTIAAVARRIGPPPQTRRIVLSLPEPIRGQTNWGSLDGRALNFQNEADRVAACRWHIETARKRWENFSPKHLELAGFYWIAENAGSAGTMLPQINQVIHAHGKKLFWIPYWQAGGAKDWQKLGFDAAYQQPNHFFKPEVADDRLDAACAFARTHGLGLEFECDARAIKSADQFRPRLHAYLEAFERNGVRTNSAMAYYEGGGALGQMAGAAEPEARALYDEVARWVISRQSK